MEEKMFFEMNRDVETSPSIFREYRDPLSAKCEMALLFIFGIFLSVMIIYTAVLAIFRSNI
jgi:uncharacterized membrane protein